MIFDLLFLGFATGALITGYKNGLIKTLLRGALFIAGGIAGMYFVGFLINRRYRTQLRGYSYGAHKYGGYDSRIYRSSICWSANARECKTI